MRYEYNWGWMILCCLWLGLEGYWAGLTIERVLPLSICLGMLCLSAGVCSVFLMAFITSKKEINDKIK